MIYIHYNNGRVLQGVVLAFSERMVRVAVEDSDDAVEFRAVNQFWITEDCEVVRFVFSDLTASPADCKTDPRESFLGAPSQPVSVQRLM